MRLLRRRSATAPDSADDLRDAIGSAEQDARAGDRAAELRLLELLRAPS